MYICCCSMAKSCPALCDSMDCSTTGSYVLHYLPEFAQIHVHWIGDAIQLSHPLLPLLLLPSIFPSISVFSSESALYIRRANYRSFSFSISPSNEYSELFSFRIDWFDFLTIPGTLKNLLQHHSSKASIFWRSVFFMVQLSQPYMTCLENPHGQKSVVGCSPWGRKESDMTERLTTAHSTHLKGGMQFLQLHRREDNPDMKQELLGLETEVTWDDSRKTKTISMWIVH